mmetsp:Transcript_125474/g.316312  ORF Transcript_125474/g.316312 Transcript_125474/m.316312 type:complete len:244 (-) Transcript_125474:1681-2412(-)
MAVEDRRLVHGDLHCDASRRCQQELSGARGHELACLELNACPRSHNLAVVSWVHQADARRHVICIHADNVLATSWPVECIAPAVKHNATWDLEQVAVPTEQQIIRDHSKVGPIDLCLDAHPGWRASVPVTEAIVRRDPAATVQEMHISHATLQSLTECDTEPDGPRHDRWHGMGRCQPARAPVLEEVGRRRHNRPSANAPQGVVHLVYPDRHRLIRLHSPEYEDRVVMCHDQLGEPWESWASC